jgi:hypothetical protein
MKSSEREGSSGADESRFAGLFPDVDYRFQMRMRRMSVLDYFKPSVNANSVLAERGRWLRAEPARHLAYRPEAAGSVEEGYQHLRELDLIPQPSSADAVLSPDQLLREIGAGLEPDVVFLVPDAAGEFRMAAACVCFPSSWSLEEKIGRPLTEIHGPVPTLNAELGGAISQFLLRMAPGIAWCRENWGLSASPELNHHPSRILPRLESTVKLSGVWLRVERQALVALPKSGGVLFAIRVEVFPIAEVISDPSARIGLRRGLETMPEDVAGYKGLTAARERIIELLA